MKIQIVDVRGNWRQVADAARTTVNMDFGQKEPSDLWKKRITIAEHSPIRLIEFIIKTEDVKSWIITHCVRHNIGITHFVSTQRSDRTGVDRDNKPQGALVNYEFCVNLQELIQICEKRFCNQAHKETKKFWEEIINALLTDEKTKDILLPIKDCFVAQCIRCGGKCPEMKSCLWNTTEEAEEKVDKYWSF